MHMTFAGLLAVGAFSAGVACQRPPQSPSAMQAQTPSATRAAVAGGQELQLVDALRSGGHVIYFRHGATDQSQTDSDPNNLANCATQRNLTDAGRAQAQTIGTAFRTLGIPV